MKSLILCFKVSAILFLSGLLLCLSSCKDDLTIEEKQGRLLNGTWSIESVEVDGVDRTDVYAGLKLIFKGNSYEAINGGEIWPASGSWIFADKTAKTILRDSALDIEILSLTSSTAVFSLTWTKTTFSAGRVSSVNGKHQFRFKK